MSWIVSRELMEGDQELEVLCRFRLVVQYLMVQLECDLIVIHDRASNFIGNNFLLAIATPFQSIFGMLAYLVARAMANTMNLFPKSYNYCFCVAS